jgi:hypothetical protein
MEFGRLLCLQFEAARKVQNLGKKLTLGILGGIKSYELPALSPLPYMLQLLASFLLLPQQKLFVTFNLFFLLINF